VWRTWLAGDTSRSGTHRTKAGGSGDYTGYEGTTRARGRAASRERAGTSCPRNGARHWYARASGLGEDLCGEVRIGPDEMEDSALDVGGTEARVSRADGLASYGGGQSGFPPAKANDWRNSRPTESSTQCESRMSITPESLLPPAICSRTSPALHKFRR